MKIYQIGLIESKKRCIHTYIHNIHTYTKLFSCLYIYQSEEVAEEAYISLKNRKEEIAKSLKLSPRRSSKGTKKYESSNKQSKQSSTKKKKNSNQNNTVPTRNKNKMNLKKCGDKSSPTKDKDAFPYTINDYIRDNNDESSNHSIDSISLGSGVSTNSLEDARKLLQ